jgi:hypothetical protein
VPDAVANLSALMADYPAPWALCGGWAVDAWLGRVTRDHGDDDVSIFADDSVTLFHHLKGWQLVAHRKGELGTTGFWDGDALAPLSHIHGKFGDGPPPESFDNVQGYPLDVQIDDREGDDWVLSRDPYISMPLRDAVKQSPWGVPTVVPEVLLFFKSRDLRRRDKTDFAALLPVLMPRQRSWLHGAIATLGHPWLSELVASRSG